MLFARPIDIYAHRTARGLITENTLPGIDMCTQMNVDYIDVDVCITKEGVVVVTHDPTLNPDLVRDESATFIEEPLHLRDLTVDQLARFDVGRTNPHSIYASYFPEQAGLETAHIPTLEEVLSLYPTHNFQIEIKYDPKHPASPEQTAHFLYNVLTKTAMIERVEIQAEELRCLYELKRLNSSLTTSLVSYDSEIDPLAIYTHGCDCWSAFQLHLTQEKIAAAQKLGIKVLAWGYPEKEGTEFDEPLMRTLITWGIDGVITDRPDKLLKLLNR